MPAVVTGFPFTSCSWTTGACVNTTPFVAAAGGWVTMPSLPAPPATAVAVNVTGSPAIPAGAASAVRVLAPAAGPSVHEVAAAMPLALVVTAATGRTEPPPVATAKVTATPDTGLVLTSRTTTDGGIATVLPAVAVWPLPALTAICVGAPGVMVTVPDTTDVSPALPKVRVRPPTVPVIESPANVARPAASVLIVAVPPRTPPPVAMATVTDRTPATAFPAASWTWTLGCCTKAIPLTADVDGWVTIASLVAAPAPIVTAAVVSGVSAPEVNRIV